MNIGAVGERARNARNQDISVFQRRSYGIARGKIIITNPNSQVAGAVDQATTVIDVEELFGLIDGSNFAPGPHEKADIVQADSIGNTVRIFIQITASKSAVGDRKRFGHLGTDSRSKAADGDNSQGQYKDSHSFTSYQDAQDVFTNHTFEQADRTRVDPLYALLPIYLNIPHLARSKELNFGFCDFVSAATYPTQPKRKLPNTCLYMIKGCPDTAGHPLLQFTGIPRSIAE